MEKTGKLEKILPYMTKLSKITILLGSNIAAVCLTFSYEYPQVLIPAGVFGLILTTLSSFTFGYLSALDHFEQGIVG